MFEVGVFPGFDIGLPLGDALLTALFFFELLISARAFPDSLFQLNSYAVNGWR